MQNSYLIRDPSGWVSRDPWQITPKVVLSLGMGVESVTVLARFLTEPHLLGADLSELLVLTAMTGDEYDSTRLLMQRHVLPMMRHYKIRYMQVARAGQSDREGVVVLDDSRSPQRMYMRGPWRLSDEMFNAGTIPMVSGSHNCASRAKGVPLDLTVKAELGGRPYRHVIGYNAGELNRIAKDQSYTRNARDPWHPLAYDWAMTRDDCSGLLDELFGVDFPRSCCSFCPYSKPDMLADRWLAEPEAAALALTMEYRTLALNPRMTLHGRKESAWQLAERLGLHRALDLARAALHDSDWAVYDIRRVYRQGKNKLGDLDPAVKGQVWRSVRALGQGTRTDMRRLLESVADTKGKITFLDERGYLRAVILARKDEPPYPYAIRDLALGPAGVFDKERGTFTLNAWNPIVPDDEQINPLHDPEKQDGQALAA